MQQFNYTKPNLFQAVLPPRPGACLDLTGAQVQYARDGKRPAAKTRFPPRWEDKEKREVRGNARKDRSSDQARAIDQYMSMSQGQGWKRVTARRLVNVRA